MNKLRIPLAFILLAGTATASIADASSIEVDAAVARMSSAAFKVEVLSVCGFPQNEKEKIAAINVGKFMALQKDDLSKKLSSDQYVTASLRTMDSALVASMRDRAKQDATPEECAKSENKDLWTSLMTLAKAMKLL